MAMFCIKPNVLTEMQRDLNILYMDCMKLCEAVLSLLSWSLQSQSCRNGGWGASRCLRHPVALHLWLHRRVAHTSQHVPIAACACGIGAWCMPNAACKCPCLWSIHGTRDARPSFGYEGDLLKKHCLEASNPRRVGSHTCFSNFHCAWAGEWFDSFGVSECECEVSFPP